MNEINYDVVHESILADIFDIIDDVKELKEKGFNVTAGSSSNYMKSISSASKDLILTFPILVSSDISIDTATKIMAAQEKKCASMLQMLFSVRDYSAAADGNVMGFLSQFHTNTNRLDMSLNDYIDVADRIMGESYKGVDLDDSGLQYAMQKALCESLGSTVLSSETNRRALKNFIVENTWMGTTVSEAGTWNEPIAPNTIPRVDKDSPNYHEYRNNPINVRAEVPHDMILPSDVKKANELMPTMMTVNFVQTSATGDPVCTRTAVLGVKCKLYPVEYADIEKHLIEKTQDKNWLINLVKASTSEISFMKDFVLALDKAKIDAKSFGANGKSNKMWKVLERRAAKSRAKRLMRKANDCTAITTLVISNNIVEDVQKQANINLMKTSTARVLLEGFNLMCMCVVDESMEIVNLLYDTGTDDGFESMSFRGLERDGKDDSYKKIVNLMSKMR